MDNGVLHTVKYLDYLNSEKWRNKRESKFKQVGRKCQKADSIYYRRDGTPVGCSGGLEVHHITYDNLYNEGLSDLLVLCEFHHKKEDEYRRMKNRHNKGLNTWASKVYGDNWEDERNIENVEQEFIDWIARQ